MLPDLSSFFAAFQSFFQEVLGYFTNVIQSLLSGFGIG